MMTRWLAAAVLAACGCDSTEPGGGGDRPTHPTGTTFTTVALDARPFGMAVSDAGLALVTRLDAARVTKVHLDPDALQGDVTVGAIPTDVAFGSGGALAWVTNQGSRSVGVVDVAAGTQIATIPVSGDPFRVVVSPDGARVYVSTNTPYLFVVNAGTRAVIDSLTAGTSINGIAISASGTVAFVTSLGDGALRRVDLGSGQVVATAAIGGALQEVVLSPAGDELYLARLDGPVEVRRTSDLSLITTIAGTEGGFGMALSPDGSQLYVTLTLLGKVAVIDRAARTLVTAVATEGLPRRVRFSPRGETAVVADEAGRVVFIR